MEAPVIKIRLLQNGFMIDRSVIMTEKAYVAESLPALHKLIDNIIEDIQKEKKQ